MPHQSRKSGGTSSTDVKKTVSVTDMSKYKRPAMSRKHTPVSSHRLGRSPREREREWQDTFDDETFPQFCMICEKQFQAYDDKHLYCSDTCRRADQSSEFASSMPSSYSSYTISSNNSSSNSYNSYYSMGETENRDIIPQACPSRPGPMYNNNGYSPPTPPGSTSHAVSALRSLSLSQRPPSPPSDNGAMFWPFGNSRNSPSTPYTRPTYMPSTYDNSYGGYSDLGNGGMGRPLPPSRHSSQLRPRSIELVTPTLGSR